MVRYFGQTTDVRIFNPGTSARLVHSIRRAAEFGIKVEGISVDWLGIRRRVEEVVAEMRALNLKNFTSLPSLDFILGTGRFLDPRRVEVAQNDGVVRQLSTKCIFIDTGTRPAIPDLPGLLDVPFLTSDTIQQLDAVPSRLLVLGAGYIGLEFAQMMRRFGSQVTVLERGEQILTNRGRGRGRGRRRARGRGSKLRSLG